MLFIVIKCNKSPPSLELFGLDRMLWQQIWSFMYYFFYIKIGGLKLKCCQV